MLGRKMIKNIEIHMHMVNFQSDEWISKVANNKDEICALVELGFEFVCNSPDGYSIFRKRK